MHSSFLWQRMSEILSICGKIPTVNCPEINHKKFSLEKFFFLPDFKHSFGSTFPGGTEVYTKSKQTQKRGWDHVLSVRVRNSYGGHLLFRYETPNNGT